MARRKYQFRPDPTDSGIWNKLYITPRQRRSIAKWGLYGLVCLGMLILQEAFLSRVRLFGGFLDLTPCAIIMICVLEGVEKGSVFAFAASLVYVFSGSAPDTLCIGLITVCATLVTLFREQFLRRSFGSTLLCTGGAMLAYELTVALVGVFFGLTYPGRIGVFALSAGLTLVSVPLLYRLLNIIGRIGGETWKE
mgnify:CR=1 FL=1